MATPLTLRLGARGSLLSRQQSSHVARALEAAHKGLRVELIIVSTTGDKIQDRPLHDFGGKGLFTKELELALLKGDIDFAVHSYKDVPVTMPLVDQSDLMIAAVPARENPRDVLACASAKSIAELAAGAKVGTGSLRRQAQLLAARPDIAVLPIRGNVDTRLRKLATGEYDAIILALAGVKRADLFNAATMTPLTFQEMLPAAGQGALALQCRSSDARTSELLAVLNDPATAQAVHLEREVVRLLNGDCHSPIAALASVTGEEITLQAAIAARDGKPPVIRARSSVAPDQADVLPRKAVSDLMAQGAQHLLAR